MTFLKLERHALMRPGSATLCSVALMHITQAVLWLAMPSAGGATCLLALLRTSHAMENPDGQHIVTAVMIAGGICGMIGTVCRVGPIRIFLFLPQQMLLGVMAFGGIVASYQGKYLDGTVISGAHIAADQMVYLFLLIAHTNAMIRRSREPSDG